MIRVVGAGGAPRQVPSSAALSILVLLQRAGVPIDTVCGGRAQCGRCAVRVLRGQERLSPIRDAESRRLASLQADGGTRLACQTYARGDIEIQILNPDKGGGA